MEALYGILYCEPRRRVTPGELRRIGDLIGSPDAEIHCDGGFGLAIKRNVIDSEGQSQGVVTAREGSVWVAVTGEIENREALVADLRSQRVDPGRCTDAEVVLALYLAGGPDCVKALRGFFNGVIWDGGQRNVLLLTDRCGGVKAMYYHQSRHFLAFGSSARAVIANPLVPRELDARCLEDLLVLGSPVAPATLFRGVFVLPAGSYVESDGARLGVKRYWRRNPLPDTGSGLDSLRERYFDALLEAVDRCSGHDDATGVMLSGGVDSSALVSLLHRLGKTPIKTFSVHTDDPADPDRQAAERVSQLFGTEHRALDRLDASCLDALPAMVWSFESPAQNIHPAYWLCRRVRQECRVALGGYGNDLVWGCWTPRRRRRLLARLHPRWTEVVNLRARRRLSRRDLRRLRPGAAATDRGLMRKMAGFRVKTGDPLNDYICLDEGLFGDQIVYREVGKSMVDAHCLWPRFPYTDDAVTHLAESVPPAARLRVLGPGRTEFKSFFKDLMRDEQVLPEDLIYRRKTWMRSPTARWLREDLRHVVAALLLGRRARARELFDYRYVERLIGEHQSSMADHSVTLGVLMAVEVWHVVFIDPPSIQEPDWVLHECATATGQAMD